MARQRPGEICILCEEYPCVCNSAKPKSPRKSPTSKPATESAAPRPSALNAMREESLRPPPPAPAKKVYTPDDDTRSWRDGVLTAHYILGATFIDDIDTREFQVILEEGPSPQLRAFLWKRGESL